MKSVIQSLILCFYSTLIYAQPFLDVGSAVLRFDPKSGNIVVGSDSQPNFFSTAATNIQPVNWALASARSLGTVLGKTADRLVVGENGRPGVFLIDTKRISCRPVREVDDLVEVFFDGGESNQLKICENTILGASGLINCVHVANQKGGGFLRLQIKDNAVRGADACRWQQGHPRADAFTPNAWRQTETRIGEVHGVQLLSELVVLDPRILRTGQGKRGDWVGEQGFIVTPYQRMAVEALIAQAQNRGSRIACSKDLGNKDGKKAEDFFCFMLAESLTPLTDFSDTKGDEDVNSANHVRKRGGYLKF